MLGLDARTAGSTDPGRGFSDSLITARGRMGLDCEVIELLSQADSHAQGMVDAQGSTAPLV